MKIDEYEKQTPSSNDRILVQSDSKTSSSKILNIINNTEFNDLNTNTKTLGGAINELVKNTYNLSGKGTIIQSGEDLKSDKFLIPGNYICNSNTVAATLINNPFNNGAFFLLVENVIGSGFIRQTFLFHCSSTTIIRTYNPGATVKWSDNETIMFRSNFKWNLINYYEISSSNNYKYDFVVPSYINELHVSYGQKNSGQCYGGGTVVLRHNEDKPCFLPLYIHGGTLLGIVAIHYEPATHKLYFAFDKSVSQDVIIRFAVSYR